MRDHIKAVVDVLPQTPYSDNWKIASMINIAVVKRTIGDILYLTKTYMAKDISITNVANIAGGEKQYSLFVLINMTIAYALLQTITTKL